MSLRPLARCGALAFLLACLLPLAAHSTELDPTSLTKYVDPLPIPGPMPQAGPNYYEIGAWEITQQLHSQLPPTQLFGYGPTQATASYPAATIEALRGVPIDIHWTNHLGMNHPLAYAFDPTIEHAITTTGIPITPHVHGAEVEPQSDGGPFTWFTANFAEKGEDWQHEVDHYVNTQQAATIWYHDHAFGYTRLNVYAGLAGFYIIRDPAHEPAGLPSGPYEIPLAIQDRSFTTDGQLWYPNVGDNDDHPVWTPEDFGETILVNGKVWPYLEVEPRKYRFRILDGSNARFYSLALNERVRSTPGPAFVQIGTDGGYLPMPVTLNEPGNQASPRLVLGPGERADVIIDFSAYAPGTEFLLRNTAKAPYPGGESPEAQTTAQVMLFRVVPLKSPDTSVIPSTLSPVPRLGLPDFVRTLTLNEVQGPNGPLAMYLDGSAFMSGNQEQPVLGSTEEWDVVNMTADTHPIHLHLVQFQVLNRQKINLHSYEQAFNLANPVLPATTYVPVPPGKSLRGRPMPPDANEMGWKDTARMNPGEVTRIKVRFAPQEGGNFVFDATARPGYVWHCHILEHEENDMMHRLMPVAAPAFDFARATSPETPAVSLAAEITSATPNPTRGAAQIALSVHRTGRYTLTLFDPAGRRVRTLFDETLQPGSLHVAWDGRDGHGLRLAAGVYFARLSVDGATQSSRRIVLF